MTRVHNFSPGPATLPTAVLERAQAELLDYAGSGMSIMEMSHRGKIFMEVAARAEQNVRTLLAVPDNYHVLFLQGGATTHFAAVPMNLLGDRQHVDYVNTGSWSAKAIKEAGKYAQVNVAASSEASNFDHIPDIGTWQLRDDAAYVHICSNETIGGVQFHKAPDTAAPLVADMSSDIFCRPIDVSAFGLIYAGAQKNFGPAGLTLVIVREDLLGTPHPALPTPLDYQVQAGSDSMSNTPPTFSWYLAGLVFEWLLEQGGLTAVQARNEAKARTLYTAIDSSNYYSSPVAVADRSIMNIPFTLADAAHDAEFLSAAQERGLMNLKGHRSVGGMRASIYNALQADAVDALVEFMGDFEREHG